MLSKMYVLAQFAILIFILLNSARMLFSVPEQSLINILRQLACAVAHQSDISSPQGTAALVIYLRKWPIRLETAMKSAVKVFLVPNNVHICLSEATMPSYLINLT